MNDFTNKRLINTYDKNGFTVKTYKSAMSDKERTLKDAQIKYDVLNIIKELTFLKTDSTINSNNLSL